MWIYPSAPQNMPKEEKAHPEKQDTAPFAVPADAAPVTPAVSNKENQISHRAGKKRVTVQIISVPAAAYLAGLLAAGLLVSHAGGRGSDFVRYFAESLLEIHRCRDVLFIFSIHFLGCFLQFSALFACGLCAFGKPVLCMLSFLKGMGTGTCAASLFMLLHLRGVFVYALFFLLGDAIVVFLFLKLCRRSCRSAESLAQMCFHKPSNTPFQMHELSTCYLISCLLGMIPCALTAALSVLFLQ